MKSKKFPQKITILYSDVKREYFPTQEQYLTEKGAKEDAEIIATFVHKLGIDVELAPGNSDLPERLKSNKPDMVINLVDSVEGKENLASVIPALLELMKIPYTGSDILGMSLDTNKFIVKKLLEQNGIPVPRFQLFSSPLDQLDPTLKFPLISKLNEIHGSVEITSDAVSENEKALRQRLKYLIETYRQPVLVEEFIVGREVTAILLEGLKKKVYMAEKDFFNTDNRKFIFLTFDEQWTNEEYAFKYQKYHDPILSEYVKKAFEITKMFDYGKFDIRIDNSGRYYFIDTNTNPAFGPKELGVAISNILDLYGVDFYEILRRLINNTLKEY